MIAWMLAVLLQTHVPPAGPLVTTIDQGTTTYVDMRRTVVVRTPEEWAKLWKSHSPNQPLPAIDFSTTMVVGVFMGARPTAGFSTEIVHVRNENGGLVVEYKETEPRRGAITAQVVTAPYHLIAVPRQDGEVSFQKVGTGK